MQTLLHIALGNAVVAAAMALLLLPTARWLKRPALTHALSLLILLKLVTPPLFNVPLMWPAPQAGEAAGHAPQTISPTQPPPTVPDQVMDSSQTIAICIPAASQAAMPPLALAVSPAPPSPANAVLRLLTSPWLAAAWAASSALYGAVMLLRIVRLRRAVRRVTVPGEDLSQEISRLARQMGLAVAPKVRFIIGAAPPMLLALFGKPCVLIPAALWSRLDDEKRQTLLLHELAHLRRRDHWVRYLELAVTCLYWWHPAVWWARSALREAEEQCCDAWVIWAMPAARRAYMTTLLDAVDFISESVRPNVLATPLLASGMGQFQHLQRRLTMVRERSVQRRLSGGGLVAVVLSAIALPLGPQLVRADDAPATPPDSRRQPPAVDERPAAATDRTDPDANERRQAPATDSQASSTRADPRQTPPARYERSGMSQIESLDAQLKAARMEIDALQQELAAAKAASGERANVIAAGPGVRAVAPEPPRVVVVDPAAPANPPSKIIIQYSNGKLEAIAIPGQKTIWMTEIGPLGTIESVAGKIVVHDANGKVYEVAVKDGRILAERSDAPGATRVTIPVNPPVAIGIPQAPAPELRGAAAPAQTEERLDAIERKLNALIEAVDRRAKLDAEKVEQADRARDAAELADRKRAEEAESDARLRREPAPAARTPSDATPSRREPAPAGSDATPPRREPAPAGSDAAPSRREPAPAGSDAAPTRRESAPADGGPSQRESTPAVR